MMQNTLPCSNISNQLSSEHFIIILCEHNAMHSQEVDGKGYTVLNIFQKYKSDSILGPLKIEKSGVNFCQIKMKMFFTQVLFFKISQIILKPSEFFLQIL